MAQQCGTVYRLPLATYDKFGERLKLIFTDSNEHHLLLLWRFCLHLQMS